MKKMRKTLTKIYRYITCKCQICGSTLYSDDIKFPSAGWCEKCDSPVVHLPGIKTTKSVYKPALLEWLEEMFEHSEKKKWYETYHAFDVHGVISQPSHRKNDCSIVYYPYAKETLQFLTKNRPDMIKFLLTSSYPNEIEAYMKQFESDGIFFKYVNENPEISDSKGSFGCYDKKPYFNSYWEDKAGFRPKIDWKPLYDYFVNSKYKPDPTWSFKYKETYHK